MRSSRREVERSKSRSHISQHGADNQSQADGQSAYQDVQAETRSRKSHTPVRTPVNEVQRSARGSHTPVREAVTPRGEEEYRAHAVNDGFGHSRFVTEREQVRQRPTQSKSPIRAEPLQYERQIEEAEKQFTRTYHQEPIYFSGQKQHGQPNQPSNFYNGYKNQASADDGAADNVSVAGRSELRADLHEDIFAEENAQKRQFQTKLDEYHRFIDVSKDVLRSKSQLKKQEAEIARQHAALIAEEKRLEELRNRDNKRRYREMLDHHQHVNYETRRIERSIEKEGERIPRDTQLSQEDQVQQGSTGSHQQPRRERPVMKQLGKDLQEAMQFRKKLDQMTREGRVGELLSQQNGLNTVEKELKERNRRRQQPLEKQTAEEQQRTISDQKNTKSDQRQTERDVDQQLVRNLQQHDENMMKIEKERKRIMQQELKDTLHIQMAHKERTWSKSPKRPRREVEPVEDDGFGTNEGRGFRNLDQRPDLEVNRTWKLESTSKNRNNDKDLVQALSDFDAMKIQEEKQRKREMALQLNQILKEQMKLNDER